MGLLLSPIYVFRCGIAYSVMEKQLKMTESYSMSVKIFLSYAVDKREVP